MRKKYYLVAKVGVGLAEIWPLEVYLYISNPASPPLSPTLSKVIKIKFRPAGPSQSPAHQARRPAASRRWTLATLAPTDIITDTSGNP